MARTNHCGVTRNLSLHLDQQDQYFRLVENTYISTDHRLDEDNFLGSSFNFSSITQNWSLIADHYCIFFFFFKHCYVFLSSNTDNKLTVQNDFCCSEMLRLTA